MRWGRERRSRVMDEKDKKVTAYHEAGHALVMYKLEFTEPLHKVTIIPRGMYLGATFSLPEKDKYHESQKQLLDEITGIMGGRIAEELIFGDCTSGAAGDIKQATHIARKMVTEWGMSQKIGMVNVSDHEEHMFLGRDLFKGREVSEETAREIDEEVRQHHRRLLRPRQGNHHPQSRQARRAGRGASRIRNTRCRRDRGDHRDRQAVQAADTRTGVEFAFLRAGPIGKGGRIQARPIPGSGHRPVARQRLIDGDPPGSTPHETDFRANCELVGAVCSRLSDFVRRSYSLTGNDSSGTMSRAILSAPRTIVSVERAPMAPSVNC